MRDKKQVVVAAMRSELQRQFDEGDLGWYAESDDYVAVDGNPDIEALADAILKALGEVQ